MSKEHNPRHNSDLIEMDNITRDNVYQQMSIQDFAQAELLMLPVALPSLEGHRNISSYGFSIAGVLEQASTSRYRRAAAFPLPGGSVLQDSAALPQLEGTRNRERSHARGLVQGVLSTGESTRCKCFFLHTYIHTTRNSNH